MARGRRMVSTALCEALVPNAVGVPECMKTGACHALCLCFRYPNWGLRARLT